MSGVTLSRKCYVFVCAGCNLLAESSRSDAMTCSGSCRVRAHRSGSLSRLRQNAALMKIRPSSIQQASALLLLRPDLEAEVMVGRLTLDEAQPMAAQAFARLLMEAAA